MMIPPDELAKRYNKVHYFGFGALLAFLPEEQVVVIVNANDTSINRDELLRVLTAFDW